MLYALLLAPSLEPLTLLRPRKHSIHPSDLRLLLTLLRSSPALREPGGESWVPFSLPKRGGEWVWIYVAFLESSEVGAGGAGAVGFVGVGRDKDGFGPMQAAKGKILKVRRGGACYSSEATRLSSCACC